MELINRMFLAVLAVTPWAAVLIGGLVLLRRYAKRLSPRFYQLAFLVVALRLALPFDFSLPKAPVQIEIPYQLEEQQEFKEIPVQTVPMPNQPEGSLARPVQAAPVQKQNRADPMEWLRFLPAVWFGGMALFLEFKLLSYGSFVLQLRKSRRIAKLEVLHAAQEAFGRKVRVYHSPDVSTPMLVGLLAPAVYLPQEGVSTQALPYVLAHEACHARRLDLPGQFLLLLAQSVHWFNPLVHRMAHLARVDMERGCDEAVLAGRDLEYRRAYGNAVLATLHKIRNRHVLAFSTGFSGAEDVKRRFKEMFDTNKKSHGLPLVAVLAAVIGAASVLVACGQSGSEPAESQAPIFADSAVQPAQAESSSEAEAEQPEEKTEQEAAEPSAESTDGDMAEQPAENAEEEVTEQAAAKADERGSKQPQTAETEESAAEVSADEPVLKEIGNAPWPKDKPIPQTEEKMIFPLEEYKYISRGWAKYSHFGVDIIAESGTPVLAAQSGTVLEAKFHYSWGNVVTVKNEEGIITLYAHCKELYAKAGDSVQAGDTIAAVGNTGSSTGNHLHFGVYKDGYVIDPANYIEYKIAES